MTAELQERIQELEAVLVVGLQHPSTVTFASLLWGFTPPQFDPDGLDRPYPEPQLVAPHSPGAWGRMFGGLARYERRVEQARRDYEQLHGEWVSQEAERLRRLEQRRQDHQRRAAEAEEAVRQHNREMEAFTADVRRGDQQAVGEFVALVLDACSYPEGFPRGRRVLYRPESKEVVVEHDLPARDVVPAVREFRYVQTRDKIEEVARPASDVRSLYARVVAQVALRRLNDVLRIAADEEIDTVTFNGHVTTTDRATGQPIHPCLIGVTVTREAFSKLVLSDLDPVACVKEHLGALMSRHPYDLEPVRPVVDFESLLAQYRFVEGMDAAAALDSRPDLLAMTPTEFEHLVRQLFEAMGLKGWTTQLSRDDGVDAVVVNEDAVFGGLCIVQAKRYSAAVGVEAVRALAGVMEDKRATKGFLVTTSWVTDEGHKFAERNARMQFYECNALRYLIKEHLGRDVLIGLPKPPPKSRRQ
jgi:restriction system protein